jgi:hypothetical protein
VAAADADAADDLVAGTQGIAAAEGNQPVHVAHATKERRVIFDEVVPLVRGKAETDRGVRLILSDLYAEQRCAVHAAEPLQDAAFVADGGHHGHADLNRLALGGIDQFARRGSRDRWLRNRVLHHPNPSCVPCLRCPATLRAECC